MSWYSFTFPYMLGGYTAAEFDIRCDFIAQGEDIVEICDIEAKVGKDQYEPCDEMLAMRIELWLYASMAQHIDEMLAIAVEDQAAAKADYGRE